MKEVLRVILIIFFGTFYRVKVINKENIPDKGAALLCANHIGELDMFFIGYRLKRLVRWMAKEELFKNKLVGAFISWLGAFPIKRGKADVESIKTSIRLLNEGHIVGIFPEGTRMRNRDRNKIKVHRGAAMIALRAGVPIIPVAIEASYKPFSKVRVVFGKPFRIEDVYNQKQIAGLNEDNKGTNNIDDKDKQDNINRPNKIDVPADIKETDRKYTNEELIEISKIIMDRVYGLLEVK